ncbi:MAG TPA: PIN domain-containing protein [Solirubrobacteraceae bacterium]|jgi:predicted nucleic acid-binding protein|nr:PIN domain-containing protein [Solirubrobacteraceae bacterium]
MLLLDNSAWSHLNSEHLDEERRTEIMDLMTRGVIATCLPFLLEAGYSAQSAASHSTMMANFERLPRVPVTPVVEERALQAQRELAAVGHHRLAPLDIMIAACAHEADAGVLHYDRDYDVLAARTTLEFSSEWVAPAGSL